MSIQESIMRIRAELIEFIQVCAEDFEDSAKLTYVIQSLSNEEVLTFYVQHTFDNEWRGELLEALTAVPA